MFLQLTRHSKLFQFQCCLWRYLSVRAGQVLKNQLRYDSHRYHVAHH